MDKSRSLWRGIALALAGLGAWPAPGWAQLAPVSGAHHAARPSDTGFQGGVSAAGAYVTSIPLDLPAAREDLPLPLQLVHGGRAVGAAGVGWNIPLTFITRSVTTAQRRPAPADAATPRAPEQYSLTLDGEPFRLVSNAAGTAWFAQRGGTQLEVRRNGDGLLVMYDGNGRSYHFSSQGTQAGNRLRGGNLFLLRSIVGASGNRVELGYSIAAPALPGGGTGLSVDLTSLAYNTSQSSANCFKHRVLLAYDAAAPELLAAVPVDGSVMTRAQKLSGISVRSRESCALAEKSLVNYSFAYQEDADTRRPRLRTVTMSGRQGTPEQSVSLPLASYSYGSVVDAANRIAYRKVSNVAVPNLPPQADLGVGYSVSQSTSTGGSALSETRTYQSLLDLNGDGRADFYTHVFAEPSSRIHTSAASAAGWADFSNAYLATDPPILAPSSRNFRAGHFRFDQYTDVDANITSDGMTQFIDMNGDGRLDLVTAGSDVWTIRLNTPDPADPRRSHFLERQVDVSNLREALTGAGHLPGLFVGDTLPLSRTTTVQLAPSLACWRHVPLYNNWLPAREEQCPGTPLPDTRKKSIVEFELKDINGDGYPDFVYNASHVVTQSHLRANPPAPPANPGATPPFVLTSQPSDLAGARDVKVFLNTAGVHIGNNERLFATQPVLLEAGGTTGCGIARWETDPADPSGGLQNQTCGIQDVNGDGIADRVTAGSNGNSAVRLGTGNSEAPFSAGAVLNIPGPLARNETPMVVEAARPGLYQPTACAGGAAIYHTRLAATLRDINGDGLPDYLRTLADGTTLEARLGTGTGFAAGVALSNSTDGEPLSLSLERSPCAGRVFERSLAGTVAGLHELDGDGQPEFLRLNAATRQWEVYQLKPPLAQADAGNGVASVPAAGRLTRIDNGYGASTTISYRSAKEEWNSAHYVPFAEIVVEAIGTRDAAGAALAATRRHAYRGAELVFDPVADAFRFPGYRRSVVLSHADGKSTATITDTYGLQPFVPGMSALQRFARYLKLGQVQEVTSLALSGSNHDNPWDVLNIDVARDPRRIAGSRQDWDVRQLAAGTAPGGNERCLDMLYPYDYAASRANALSPDDDVCMHRGFAFQRAQFAWRGNPGTADALASPHTVQSNSEVLAIDDLERVTRLRADNDLNQSGDDLCSETLYATPTGSAARQLNAVFRHTTTNCAAATVLARDTFEYDTTPAGVKLPQGRVGLGRLTSHVVARVDNTSGLPVDPAEPEIRLFDAQYDQAGNRSLTTRLREDGATIGTTISYDDFGLVPLLSRIDARNANGQALPALNTSRQFDPLSLQLLGSIDPNGTRRGSVFDGFGRTVRATVTAPGGTEGVLARISYEGFGIGQSGGRRIVSKTFRDAVPEANVNVAAGRSSSVFLDSLGRTQRAEQSLGADYANQTLVLGQREYDAHGRVAFVADPFLRGGNFATVYGTTRHYHDDGFPQCTYRAYGRQPYAANPMSDEASERYVACAAHSFAANREVISGSDADARLAGSPQQGVTRRREYSALGQLLRDETVAAGGAALQETASFSYDALGRLLSMTRNRLEDGSAVQAQWRHDSLGQVLRLSETGTTPQQRRYDRWGALIATERCEPAATACADGQFNRGSYQHYDALGRLVHSEERSDGVAVPATVRDFSYDTAVNHTTPPLSATYVLGRLARASAASSAVSYSYDAYGRVQALAHVDRSNTPDVTSPDEVYLQKHDYHGDGSLLALHLQLPDSNFRDERADYTYDSMGRLRTVKFADGVIQKDLFVADAAGALDVLGRIRQARFGANFYTADYAEAGRRLLERVKVNAPGPSTAAREFVFAGSNGALPAFDPLGRERSRQEIRNGNPDPLRIESQYDALGRLALTSRRTAAGHEEREFGYDSLGNLLAQIDEAAPAQTVTASYTGADRDRICSIAYGPGLPQAACNVKYDGAGNILEMPTRAGAVRTLSYFPGGQLREMAQAGALARYDYDAFGAVQRLSVSGGSSSDTRRDKHFGAYIYQREEQTGGVRTPVNTRSFPGPAGLLATRHGANADSPWTFAFGELRGNRFFTDGNGAFVQDLDYHAYGETRPADPALPGSLPGSPLYTNRQWNGGDALAAFGVSRLGARLYDPVIGRFLSRDPLLIPRTAATTNPYAFALNDPINRADPSGLDTLQIDYCLSCRIWREGGALVSVATNVIESVIRGAGSAIGAVGSALGSLDWGGGPLLPRSSGSVVSLNWVYKGSPGATPTTAGRGGNSGGGLGNHVAGDGSVGPAIAGPPGGYIDDTCSVASCAGSPSAADSAPAPTATNAARKPLPESFYRQYHHGDLHDSQTDATLDLLEDVTETPGDAMDIAKYVTGARPYRFLGTWMDRIGVSASLWRFARDPTLANFGALTWNVTGNVLMKMGPWGWTAKLGAENVAPVVEQGVKETIELDRRLQNSSELLNFWQQLYNGPSVHGWATDGCTADQSGAQPVAATRRSATAACARDD